MTLPSALEASSPCTVHRLTYRGIADGLYEHMISEGHHVVILTSGLEVIECDSSGVIDSPTADEMIIGIINSISSRGPCPHSVNPL